MWDFSFFINSILLGVGLAMDAFSVSLANGFHYPMMKKGKMNLIAGSFSLFQFGMPMIGWICVHTIVQQFKIFEYFIPWIALVLLSYIGGKMIYEFFKKRKNNGEEIEKSEKEKEKGLTFSVLMLQSIATSIDALSVGFTIAEYDIVQALICCLIICVLTFIICIIGLFLGKKFGTKFADKAELVGGIILVGIGLEIFIKGMITLYA